MQSYDRIKVIHIRQESDRQAALEVLSAIYRDEKKWLQDPEAYFKRSDLSSKDVSWFAALIDGQPVGVVRILYKLPLDIYASYGIQKVDPTLDVEAFLRNHRIAEIGRFAVLGNQRRNPLVAAALMRSASQDTIERGYTHYVTDVFEGEKHSPYEFHTRVMGFQTVATHDHGELNCRNRRLTLVLDLRACYRRLKQGQSWFFRHLTRDWPADLHHQMSDRHEKENDLLVESS